MKFQVSDGEKYQKILEAEIPAEEMGLAIRQAGKRLASKFNIPGFRKGKAPQSIIENYVGVDAILQEAADELLPQAYFKGLQELELDPVEQPKVEIVQLKPNEPMIFKATFTVKPQVKLGKYQGLPVSKYVREATEAEVDADVEAQRQRLARTETAEEGYTAVEHDVVSIDFEGFRNGIPFDGGKAEKYALELGSHNFIPGFEEQLIGIAAGEEREINVTFPEEYQEESLAGQPVLFKVKAHEIKRRELPALDDEFAQEVSETAETLADLRNEVKARLDERHSEAAERDARERALELAVANASIDLPPVMIEQRLDSMVNNMAERLQAQGLDMEQFLAYTGQNTEQLREGYRAQAEQAVRSDLVLDAIIDAENISVSDEELEQELEMMASQYWQPLDQVKELMSQNNRMSALIEDMQMKKAADFIYDAAEITEEAAPAPEKKPAAKKAAAKKPTAKKTEEKGEEKKPAEKKAAPKKSAAAPDGEKKTAAQKPAAKKPDEKTQV